VFASSVDMKLQVIPGEWKRITRLTQRICGILTESQRQENIYHRTTIIAKNNPSKESVSLEYRLNKGNSKN
jgi:hypothetical protein